MTSITQEQLYMITNACTQAWPPQITVAAVIYQAGKFLIVEESANGRIVLNQPAGHVESGESLIDAIRRETLEETAWHFHPEAIVGIYFFTAPETGITYQRICFTGSIDHHEKNRDLDQVIIQTHWFTRDELLQQNEKLRSPMVLHGIDDFLAHKSFPLTTITDLRQR